MQYILYTTAIALILLEAVQCVVLIVMVLAVRRLAKTPYISNLSITEPYKCDGIDSKEWISKNIKVLEKALPKIEEEEKLF